ncbi:MAG: hypothetical protein RL187_531 [Actinomycetota bacterium]
MNRIWIVSITVAMSAACSGPVGNPAPSEDSGISAGEITGPTSCQPSTEGALRDTISAQIDAFGDKDFSSAYQFAAPGFQEVVSLEAFEEIIVSQYASLLDAQSVSFSDCVEFPGALANTVVTVRTRSGGVSTYYYELIETDQGWRVIGAAEIAAVSSDA